MEGSSELFRQGWKKEEEAQSAELERAYRQVGRLPIRGEFVYLTAVMDWYSRYVLSWEVSITMDDSFCVSALERALRRYQKPEIFNSDQGSQYTGAAFTGALKSHHVQISMDGKGRVTDNIMIERLWRSLQYEDIYIKDYRTAAELVEELRKDSLSSANPCPKTGRVNSRTFHLNFQKNGLDNWVHLIDKIAFSIDH